LRRYGPLQERASDLAWLKAPNLLGKPILNRSEVVGDEAIECCLFRIIPLFPTFASSITCVTDSFDHANVHFDMA